MSIHERTSYLFESPKLSTPIVVVDVGANPLSPPPYQGLLDAGLCQVYGFEPQTEAYEELQRTKGPNEEYFPNAVADGKDHILYVSPNSGFTSILSFFKKGFLEFSIFPGAINNLTKVPVKTVSLDSLKELPKVDLLKIDIQGGEKLVIENGKKKLSQAIAIIPEVRFSQLYNKEPMFGGLDVALRKQGFILHKFLFAKKAIIGQKYRQYIAVKDNANHLVDGDAVYIRDLMRHEKMDDEQIKKLAILSDHIFKSFDLTLHCIDLLERRNVIDSDIGLNYISKLPGRFRKGDTLEAGDVAKSTI